MSIVVFGGVFGAAFSAGFCGRLSDAKGRLPHTGRRTYGTMSRSERCCSIRNLRK